MSSITLKFHHTSNAFCKKKMQQIKFYLLHYSHSIFFYHLTCVSIINDSLKERIVKKFSKRRKSARKKGKIVRVFIHDTRNNEKRERKKFSTHKKYTFNKLWTFFYYYLKWLHWWKCVCTQTRERLHACNICEVNNFFCDGAVREAVFAN